MTDKTQPKTASAPESSAARAAQQAAGAAPEIEIAPPDLSTALSGRR